MSFSVWPVDGTLTATTNPGHSGHGSNSNEGVLTNYLKLQDKSITIGCSLAMGWGCSIASAEREDKTNEDIKLIAPNSKCPNQSRGK